MTQNSKSRRLAHVGETGVKSVSEFLKRCQEIRTRFKFKADDPWEPWFRGHQRAEWKLSPKLYRNYGGYRRVKEKKIEDEMREEFITRAPILCENPPTGDKERAEWEWYFMMQHFRAPTRLLDWTDGSLIALYFAVKDNPGLYEAAVWALDPYELNRRIISREEVIAPSATGIGKVDLEDKRRVAPWLPPRFVKMKALPKSPIAIFPTHVARRISTQRSCFTIHGTDEDGLDRLYEEKTGYLEKIVIPAWRVQAIRRELGAAGIDETTIFPDLDGLGRAISARWESESSTLPHEGVYTRLRPSKVHKGGVGVFAIVPIRKGEPLFSRDNPEMLWVSERSLLKKPKAVRRLYKDFAVRIQKHGLYGCPTSFNRLTVGWYLNEPKSGTRPNVRGDPETYDFFALRDIRPGEELVVDYSPWSD
jgi:hypothetical protein